jgi:hypothetical protein
MASNLDDKKGGAADLERASIEVESFGKGDILQLEHTDPVLNAKMHLVNNVSTTDTFCKRHLLLENRPNFRRLILPRFSRL